MVLKASEVESGKLLATVFSQDDLFGDTQILSFEETDEPSEVQVARRFAAAYGQQPGGRNLVDLAEGLPFPDVTAVDAATGRRVGIELTQLAYEGWQETQARAERLKKALQSRLSSERPKYRARAMVLYFKSEQKRPRIPGADTKKGRAFLEEFFEALESGFWVVSEIPSEGEGKPLRLETLNAPGRLTTLHHHLDKVELSPTAPTDPRLPSPDDPLLLFNTHRVIEEGDFARLVERVLRKKLGRGPAYSAEILLIHNAADPHALVAAEDEPAADLARDVVLRLKEHDRFGEIWLFDLFDNSLFKLT